MVEMSSPLIPIHRFYSVDTVCSLAPFVFYSDTRGTAARCEIPALSSRSEVVEASVGGQVLMNSRRCLRRSTRESSGICGAASKNNENCDMRTAGSMEATGVGLRDLRNEWGT